MAERFAVARYLADGSLDPDFGNAGTVEADLLPDPSAREVLASVAATPDGEVVVAGHMAADGVTPHVAVVRWTADGTLDASFGTGGVATYEGVPASEASSVAVQDDGRIVVAGRAADNPVPPGPAEGPGQLGADTDWTWALLRLTDDGALDPSFGDGGVTRTAVGKRAQAMVLQRDGRIVVAGCSCPQYLSGPGGVETESALVVARYLREGTPEQAGTIDRGFGSSGLSSVHVGERYSEAFDAAVDGEGRVVLAGLSSRSFGLTRLLPDGTVDIGFGDGGTVITPIGSAAEAHAVVVQPDGRIVVAGRTASVDASSFALVRYLPDGALDPGFGEGGIVTTAYAGYPDAKALVLLPDGRLLAAGSAAVGDELRNTGYLVARYLPDGRVDPSFGDGGLAMVDVRGALDHATALVVQDDGRVVVGGTSNDPGGAQESPVVLARLLDDGSLDPSFGDAGRASADLGPGYDALGGLALQPDGALVAAADTDPYAAAPLAVARFTRDGVLDASFGTAGVTTTDLPGPSRAADVTVADDGRVLVAGTTGADPDIAWVVLGYTPAGAPDPSFGRDGVVRTAAGERANALVLHPDEGLVVAGCDCPELQYSRGGAESTSSFVAVRYLLGD